MIKKCPPHTQPAFNQDTFKCVVEWVSERIRTLEVDAIAACGHSGLTVASAVSYVTGINLIAVRKPDDSAIADRTKVNTFCTHQPSYKSYAIIDDVISSGGTSLHMIAKIWESGISQHPLPKSIILYNDYHREMTHKRFHAKRYLQEWIDDESVRMELENALKDCVPVITNRPEGAW